MCVRYLLDAGLDEQVGHSQKQAAELEASATALASLKAEHADAVRRVEADCEEKCRAISTELTERVAEIATISGQVEAANRAGADALSRESAKASAAMLAMRADLERSHEEAMREAMALERSRANEQRLKAVAEVEAKGRAAERAREMEHAALAARNRAEQQARDQQQMNQAALSSYATELSALRESLGAKKSALLPRGAAAGAGGGAAPDPYVSHRFNHGRASPQLN
jgi:chromosome segregation ATPase